MKQVIKKDSSTDNFSPNKLITAIWRAQKSTGVEDYHSAVKIAEKVIQYLNLVCEKEDFAKVEQIRNITTRLLQEEGLDEISQAYSEYRKNQNIWCQISNKLAAVENPDSQKMQAHYFKEALENSAFCPSKELLRNFTLQKKVLFSEIAVKIDSEQDFFTALSNLVLIKNNFGSLGINFGNFESKNIINLVKILGITLQSADYNKKNRLFLNIQNPHLLKIISVKESLEEMKNINIAFVIDNEFLNKLNNNGELEISQDGYKKMISAENLISGVIDFVSTQKNSLITFSKGDSNFNYYGLAMEKWQSGISGSIDLLELDQNCTPDQAQELLLKSLQLLKNSILCNEYLIPQTGITSKEKPSIRLKLKKLAQLLKKYDALNSAEKTEKILQTVGNLIKTTKTNELKAIEIDFPTDIDFSYAIKVCEYIQLISGMNIHIELNTLQTSEENVTNILKTANQCDLSSVVIKNNLD